MEKLSKNFIWMAAANVVSSLFSIALFVYLARILMPEALGYLSYAFTLIFFLFNFIDLGMSTYGIREIAKDRRRASEYVSEIVSFRLLVAFIMAALLAIAVFLIPCQQQLRLVILESSLMLLTFALATDWAFQGLENMFLVFLSLSITGALQLGAIYLLVKGPEDLLKIAPLYFLSTLPIIAIFLWVFRFKLKIDLAFFKRVIGYMSSSLVIWAISIFAQIYNSVDLFILGFMKNLQEVGYFSIARRFVGGIALFMVFLTNAALPRLSFDLCHSEGQFRGHIRKFLNLIIIITLFLLVPIVIFSDKIVATIFGAEYLPASLPLKLMLAGIIFVIFNLPYSTALIACGLEKEVLKQAFASAVVNVAANLALIPRYGMLGASVSFIMAEILALVWILWIYKIKMASGSTSRRLGEGRG